MLLAAAPGTCNPIAKQSGNCAANLFVHLQDIQHELAALERSEQQDQQRAVAMAEEHMTFLQSAGESQQQLQQLRSLTSSDYKL